jgi:hypothetical protein
MNKIIFIISLFAMASCQKEGIETPQAGVVTATIHKVSTVDTVELLVNHLRRISATDTTSFKGVISWGDGTFTTFNNPTLSSVNVIHRYSNLGIFPIEITFEKPDAVTSYTLVFRGSDRSDTLLSLTNISSIPYLKHLVLEKLNLKDLDITGNSRIETLWLQDNRLSNFTINSLLTHMDSYIGFNQSPSPLLQLNRQTPASAPTNAGLIAKQNLINKGCNVLTD